jgi:hypothetical protein
VYRCTAQINDDERHWSLELHQIGGAETEARFLVDSAPWSELVPGASLRLFEGNKLVAQGQVLKKECQTCWPFGGFLMNHLDKDDKLLDPPRKVPCPACNPVSPLYDRS